MLGISGISAVASLTPYRPYFLAVTFLALGYAYVMTYRRRWEALRLTGLKHYRPVFHEVVLWFMTGLVLAVALLPHYSIWLFQLAEAVRR